MTLIAELKRRKVFRVGAAYLVAGWLLIQVASTVAPQLNLPGWMPRAVTFAIVLGFPIALILSWLFDAGPGGIRRETVAAHADGAREPAPDVAPTQVHAAAPSALDIPRKSIAVLPFADLSPERDQEYFSDGIAEEILNALVKLKDLKVAGRTSSFSFKGRNEDLRGIGKTLSVAHVLEGSVRKHGDKVRITAQLIQTEDGYHLWSESYDGDLSDVFELQERIARAIARELDVILHGEQRLVPVATASPEAYALYLQATGIFNRRDGARFPEAVAGLHQAIALDPKFARAHARLASIHALEPIYAPERAATSTQEVLRAASRASAIDPTLAEPYAAIAMNHTQQHRFLEAREAIDRALALDPGDVNTVFWAAILCISVGYTAMGCAALERVLAIDPMLPNALLWRGVQYVFAGDIARAGELLRRAEATGLAHVGYGLHWVSAARDDVAGATAQLTEGLRALGAGMPADAPAVMAQAAFGDAGARAKAFALIEGFLAEHPDGLPSMIPCALFLLGEPVRALTLSLERKSSNDAQYFQMFWAPAQRPLRALPEFRGFIRAIGMIALWDRYGPPDGAHRDPAGEYVWD